MEKLTLEHLAPYLPYGLKMLDGKKVYELNNLSITYKAFHSKPILRPLSDLKNHKLFDWYLTRNHEIEDLSIHTQEGDILLAQLEYFDGKTVSSCVPLSWYTKLFEYHFDVFGLIDKGLAIDINTLN